MNPMSSMRALGLICVLAGATFLVTGLIVGYAALWGVAPGLTALGVTFMALSRTRRT